MKAFIRRIRIGSTSCQLYFNPVDNAQIPSYHVSLVDHERKVQVILLNRKGDHWMVKESSMPGNIVDEITPDLLRAIVYENNVKPKS